MTHEVAYESLPPERRRALHARVLDIMEGLDADRLSEYIDRLAYHAWRGQVWAKGLTYLRQAGIRAFARSANREAAVYFDQALTAIQHLPESPELREQAIDLRFDLRRSSSAS